LGKEHTAEFGAQKGAAAMKSLLCFMAMSLWFWPACSTQQNAASPNENTAVETARQEKQMYQDRVETNLRDLDRKIDVLKAKIAKANKVDRKQLDQEMAELDRKSEIAHQKLERLQISSQEAWVNMKAGIDSAMDDLETAYKQAVSHFQ
jgi:TolA-binding protein